MKPMTEQEARAALKSEMPWATDIDAISPSDGLHAHVWASREPVYVECNAPTLRAAVDKAIKAWRATQKKPAKRSALAKKWERIGKEAGGTKSFTQWKKGAKR